MTIHWRSGHRMACDWKDKRRDRTICDSGEKPCAMIEFVGDGTKLKI
jgi:hypothetical protein